MQQEAAMMSFAFACELALKGMTTEPKMGHDLVRLFGKLEPSTQDWLVDRYLRERGAHLVTDLTSCRNLFVEFRYYHENNGFVAPMGLLQSLSKFLIDAGAEIISLRPDKEIITSEVHFLGGLSLPGPADKNRGSD